MTCDDDEANVNGTSALPALACDDVTNVLVDAEDGANTVNLGGLTLLAFPLLARTSIDVADSDADSITGSEARDVVSADFLDDASTGLGDDWVEGAGSVSGGEGNDTLREISGSVQGGSGDDLIVGAPAGLIDGGSGFDSVVIDYSAFTSQTTINLAITDTNINGAIATAGIEAYDVTASDGVRADGINSSSYSGRVSFHGRAGNDTFLGGPGADVADLALGNDVVDPGPGSDFVLTGEGDDTIAVRDGFGDVVECGQGTDTVTADRVDVLSGCENVALPPPDTSRIDGPTKVTKGTEGVLHVRRVCRECDVRVPGRHRHLQAVLEPVQGEDQEAQDREAHADRAGRAAGGERRPDSVDVHVQGQEEEVAIRRSARCAPAEVKP